MRKGTISYWAVPVVSGVVWLATLLGLLLYWVVNTKKTVYVSMEPGQTVAFISDVSASELKPLFITGCVVTTVFLDIGFALDRWLRHTGRLVPNSSRSEKVLKALTIVFAFVGTVGLILLSVFDTVGWRTLHNTFLLLFVAGYLLSAIFICWEYQILGKKNRDHRMLHISFWVKLVFVIVELVLAVVFVVMTFRVNRNVGAIVEWIIAFVFSLYIFSFVLDLYPAIYTRSPGDRYQRAAEAIRTQEEGASVSQPFVHPLLRPKPAHF